LDEPAAGPMYFPDDKLACTPLGDRLRIAGMMEFRRGDEPFDPRRIKAVARAAAPWFNDLALDDPQVRADEWVGSRPCTPDGLPLIGRTSSPRIAVAGGHGMWGVVQGPRTGKLLAQHLTGPPVPALTSFDPLRRGTVHNVILASASPARLATLRAAGVEPEVITSSVDEPAVVAQALQENPDLHASDEALLLARAKAEDVAGRDAHSAHTDQIVIGCDSILEFDGQSWGKPLTAERARERWRMMRGKSGVLHSGHWIIAGDRASGVTVSTTVCCVDISDQEIDAYV